MRRQDFHYELPPELIAQRPLPRRGESRLLVMEDGGGVRDARIAAFDSLLQPGDLVVFNDTRVIPARLLGHKDSGGRVEVLVERVTGKRELLAQVRASKPPKPGSRIAVEGGGELEVLGRDGEFFRLSVTGGDAQALLERAGHMPLPPYVDRPDTLEDRERYQTVFAREPGAVAAPTAGLHFDDAALQRIRDVAELQFLTLHVGAGTFQPLRVDDVSQHRMHAERYVVSEALAAAVVRARERGGRVVAVGTTVVRTLESAADEAERVRAGHGETRLFITPGYRFRVVDAMLTNFHLPESTLLMLVCAFAGKERTLAAYAHAVRERYRFFSYGDAMFIPRRNQNE